MIRLQKFVFRLFEQRRLRDWFYTIAFIIFVPVGYRFATLAWEYGDWFDKPLAVIAGFFIGVTAVVTLMRFWQVPPAKTVTPAVPELVLQPKKAVVSTNDYLAAARRRAAENRAMARGARVLGSTMGRYR